MKKGKLILHIFLCLCRLNLINIQICNEIIKIFLNLCKKATKMIILYISFFLLLFIPFPKFITQDNDLYFQYLSKDAILPIKGFSLGLVFFRHFIIYVTLSNSFLDISFIYIDRLLDQLIVTMFFMYSGYGIYESIKIKGSNYIKNFPKRRFLSTWIKFAILICLFLMFDIMMGHKFDLFTIILSFIGWTSIGNSNWFIFVTFVLYILVYISFFWIYK